MLYVKCLDPTRHDMFEVGTARKPLSASSGMTIAQEAARNVDPATAPKTAEEEEKQRKRLEAWKKMQGDGKEEKEEENADMTLSSG